MIFIFFVVRMRHQPISNGLLLLCYVSIGRLKFVFQILTRVSNVNSLSFLLCIVATMPGSHGSKTTIGADVTCGTNIHLRNIRAVWVDHPYNVRSTCWALNVCFSWPLENCFFRSNFRQCTSKVLSTTTACLIVKIVIPLAEFLLKLFQ